MRRVLLYVGLTLLGLTLLGLTLLLIYAIVFKRLSDLKIDSERHTIIKMPRRQAIMRLYSIPKQIHLTFGESEEEIVVIWSTFNDTQESIVGYSVVGEDLRLTAKGNSTLFIEDGPEKRMQYIHRVTLPKLKPKQKYTCRCGSEIVWSPVFSFTTVYPDSSPKLFVYQGINNSISEFIDDSEIANLIRNVNYVSNQTIENFQPEQIHLAFGETVEDIVVTWSTFNDTLESTVEYNVDGRNLSLTAKGTSTLFIDDGYEKRFQYIHRVTLPKLKPKQKYMYHCGSELGWSPLFFFTTVDPGTAWSPKLLVYGDMGNEGAQSLPYLKKEARTQSYAAILHVGDMAYDMDDHNGQVGDEFMNLITPLAGYIPYMVSPGNHEAAHNFSHYKNRFSMPGPYESMMYSWNLGPIHFISLNTEVYYFLQYGIKQIILQYEWLKQDLAEANKPDNRAVRPWIITYGHRPMYCSNADGDDCTTHSSRVRTGVPYVDWFGLEKLLYDAGVDLEIWAHEHSYERMWPVYDHVILNGSTSHPYTNPKGPVHIVSGSAGCIEFVDSFIMKPQPWSAFRSSDYGYTRMQVFNLTHLYWDQISVNQEGEIIDSTWLIKDTHGKY